MSFSSSCDPDWLPPVQQQHIERVRSEQPPWNWSEIELILASRENTIEWAKQNNLIHSSYECRYHRKAIVFDINRKFFGQFRCPSRNKGKVKGGEVSPAKGTWFDNHSIPPKTMIRLMYSWSLGSQYTETMKQCQVDTAKLSNDTVADWYSFCRELVSEHFINDQQTGGQIGGPGRIVQIDEAKFGRRKYHRGRRVKGHWILGLIEDGSDDLRLEICPDNIRSAAVLVPLIQKHVAPGTLIRTDGWKGYSSLKRLEYLYETVNHSKEFVTEEGVHTNRIESMWQPMRAYFRGHLIGKNILGTI